MNITDNDKKRFWDKVGAPEVDGCWPWIASKTEDGYGEIRVRNRIHRAHRISFELRTGADPEELHVLHTCDNPGCVNPIHLFLGNNAINVRDRDAKGRQAKGVVLAMLGTNNPMAKLTPTKVRDIFRLRSENWAQNKIGDALGVSQSLVSQVLRRIIWRHVEVEA